jgi:hypothetical protein
VTLFKQIHDEFFGERDWDQPFDRGYADFFEDESRVNPYPEGSHDHQEWNEGRWEASSK